nr:MAG TPA: hypothetical protein [Caudoviricetes sp.]
MQGQALFQSKSPALRVVFSLGKPCWQSHSLLVTWQCK